MAGVPDSSLPERLQHGHRRATYSSSSEMTMTSLLPELELKASVSWYAGGRSYRNPSSSSEGTEAKKVPTSRNVCSSRRFFAECTTLASSSSRTNSTEALMSICISLNSGSAQ